MRKDIKKSILKIILFTSIFVIAFTTLVFADIKVTEVEIKGDYDFIDFFSEGLATVRKDEKYGYIDTKLSEGKSVVLERQEEIEIPAYNGNLNFEYVND